MITALILATSTLLAITKADLTFHNPVHQHEYKRDYLTCQQTYGGGSMTCGDDTSHFCFDPTRQESCCILDKGYCKEGDFCAPVAGFCCHNVGDPRILSLVAFTNTLKGEDPESCAKRLDFNLPSGIYAPFQTNDWTSTRATETPSPTSFTPTAIPTSSADSEQKTDPISVTTSSPETNTLLPTSTDAAATTWSSTWSTGMHPDFTAQVANNLNTTMIAAPTATASTWVQQPGSLGNAGGVPFTGEGARMKLDLGLVCGLILLGGVAVNFNFA